MTTFIHNGIEIVFPILYKVYRRAWAINFIENGEIYFTSLKHFHCLESADRGDKMEGVSVVSRNGATSCLTYLYPVFVWCCTMENSKNILLTTWPDRDCVLRIDNAAEFFLRIRNQIHKTETRATLAVGPVTYDKDVGRDSDYYWLEGIFQKNEKFGHQKEFRIALSAFTNMDDVHLVLNLGNCNNIARII